MRTAKTILAFLAISGCAFVGMILFLLFSPLLSSAFDTGMMGGMMIALMAGSIAGSAIGCLLLHAEHKSSVGMKVVSLAIALVVPAVSITVLFSEIRIPREWERLVLFFVFMVAVPFLSLCGFRVPLLLSRREGKGEGTISQDKAHLVNASEK